MTPFSPGELLFDGGRPSAPPWEDDADECRPCAPRSEITLWIALGSLAIEHAAHESRSRRTLRLKPVAEVRREIHWARAHRSDLTHVTLADERAVRAPVAYLRTVLDALWCAFPALELVEARTPTWNGRPGSSAPLERRRLLRLAACRTPPTGCGTASRVTPLPHATQRHPKWRDTPGSGL